MQYPGYTAGKVILTEGEWFLFKVHNLVKLKDNEWYYILQDINGLKHFMAAHYYKNYGFVPGDEISCKIDRINCTGRMYLEPKHPYYTAGEIYNFEILNFTDLNNEIVLKVKGYSEDIIELHVFNLKKVELKEGKIVRCNVITIKKGKPILEFHSFYP